MVTQNTQFAYTTRAQFRSALQNRLNDTAGVFWTTAELNLYIAETLSFWNVLTQYWPQDYTFTLNPPLASDWIACNPSGSPRQQTYTETDVYSIALYHLMEPQLIAGVWQGTIQYNASILSNGLQQTLNEIILRSACRMSVNESLSVTPNTNRVYLPDTTLDVRRVRYKGADGTNATLVRGDSLSFLRFTPQYRQTSGTPLRWDVLGSPPLALTLDTNVNQANTLEIMLTLAANTLDPTSAQPLGIPNDWMWLAKYGMLADLYANEPEATDSTRAEYCKQRYDQGMQLMQSMPWLLNGFINEVACDTVPIAGKDRYSYEWQASTTTWPGIVVGGVDLIAVAPIPTASTGVKLTVVGNAPQPTADGDYIQAPQDVIDAMLDYCQHIATLKSGGEDFLQTIPLYQNFISYALRTGSRMMESGIFATDLRPPVERQDLEQPRYAEKE